MYFVCQFFFTTVNLFASSRRDMNRVWVYGPETVLRGHSKMYSLIKVFRVGPFMFLVMNEWHFIDWILDTKDDFPEILLFIKYVLTHFVAIPTQVSWKENYHKIWFSIVNSRGNSKSFRSHWIAQLSRQRIERIQFESRNEWIDQFIQMRTENAAAQVNKHI